MPSTLVSKSQAELLMVLMMILVPSLAGFIITHPAFRE